MARLALNKASLSRQKADLETYRRFLPSLDLKRRQLIAERTKAAQALVALRDEIRDHVRRAGEIIPMLANRDIPLDDLVRVKEVRLGEQNLMGARLPTLEAVEIAVQPYGLLIRPHWVDRLVELWRAALMLRLREQVVAARLERLELAVRKVTQRVNLFDKVLIPRARANIRRIEIALSDTERAAVVRSKIAKAKHAADGAP